jgi:hypothetical protein
MDNVSKEEGKDEEASKGKKKIWTILNMELSSFDSTARSYYVSACFKTNAQFLIYFFLTEILYFFATEINIFNITSHSFCKT